LENLGAVEGIFAAWFAVHFQQKTGDVAVGQQAFVHRQGRIDKAGADRFASFRCLDHCVGAGDGGRGAGVGSAREDVPIPEPDDFVNLLESRTGHGVVIDCQVFTQLACPEVLVGRLLVQHERRRARQGKLDPFFQHGLGGAGLDVTGDRK